MLDAAFRYSALYGPVHRPRYGQVYEVRYNRTYGKWTYGNASEPFSHS